MFLEKLRLKRSDLSLKKLSRALPLFLLLWGICSSIIWGGFFFIRGALQQIERTAAIELLGDVIETSVVNGVLAGDRFPRVLPLISPKELSKLEKRGLLFVRFTRGKEQLLFSGDEHIDFSTLTNLSQKESKVWLELTEKHKNSMPLLTVAARHLGEDFWLQVGKTSQESWRYYLRLYRYAFFALAITGLSLFPVAIVLIKNSLSPLAKTVDRLATLTLQSPATLLPEQGNGPELNQLYRQINSVLRHNHLLVKEMEQALDNVAHDLRTPMTRLRSVAEYSLQEENPARLREALADCLEEAEQVLRMLQVMMSVAEAEAGTMRLELAQVDLRDSLERAVTLYEYVAEEKRIKVECTISEPLPIRVDETRITQVWANLLDNAFKYGRRDGWVCISGKKRDNELEISFTDNGQGISALEQQRIWERLYRGDRSRSEKGLGLGLSYVKAVVEAHGGRVVVESELYKGAKFTVYLPWQQQPTSLPSLAPA